MGAAEIGYMIGAFVGALFFDRNYRSDVAVNSCLVDEYFHNFFGFDGAGHYGVILWKRRWWFSRFPATLRSIFWL